MKKHVYIKNIDKKNYLLEDIKILQVKFFMIYINRKISVLLKVS